MESHNRFKGADWYNFLNNDTIKSPIIGGAGGLGSWFGLFFSRIFNDRIIIYDFDTFETTNLAGQFLTTNQIGMNKATVLVENMKRFSMNVHGVPLKEEYKPSSYASPIMISCFDNMEARKIMFEKWLSVKNDFDYSIFIDMRLIAESFTIFCIRRNDEERIKDFQENELYSSDEVTPQECTLKQTTHCAALCTSMAIGFFTNHVANISEGVNYRKVPYKTEYMIALNKIEEKEL